MKVGKIQLRKTNAENKISFGNTIKTSTKGRKFILPFFISTTTHLCCAHKIKPALQHKIRIYAIELHTYQKHVVQHKIVKCAVLLRS